MGYSRENRQYAAEILAERRQSAERRAAEHRAHLHSVSEEAVRIDRELSQAGLEAFRIAISGGNVEERIDMLRRSNEELQARRRALLVSLGLPEDYTKPDYTCKICNDTGYTDKGLCACHKRLLTEAGFRSSGLGGLIGKQSFENFDLSFYTGDALPSARRALNDAKRFAEEFNTDGSHLLFVGGTGLGKTHLSTAIARRAIERGFDVVYETAQNIIADFEYDRFKSGYGTEESRSEKYFEADLLIMDDLGAELTNQFTVASLYNIINTRINRGKSMIISTNLGQKGLLERYDERITSRLFGEFYVYLFKGTDIRSKR